MKAVVCFVIAYGIATANPLLTNCLLSAQAADPELVRLRSMIGQWTVVETFESKTADKREGRGTLTVRQGPGGNSVFMEYRSIAGPMNGFQLFQILSWHPGRRVFQMVYVTSFHAGMSTATGQLEGTDIVFLRQERIGEAIVTSKSVLSDLKDGQFTLSSYEAKESQSQRRTLVLQCTKE